MFMKAIRQLYFCRKKKIGAKKVLRRKENRTVQEWDCGAIKGQQWLSGKESTCSAEALRGRKCGFDPWVWKIPWKMVWQPTPVLLPGESHGQRSLADYAHRVPKGRPRLKWLSMHAGQPMALWGGLARGWGEKDAWFRTEIRKGRGCLEGLSKHRIFHSAS